MRQSIEKNKMTISIGVALAILIFVITMSINIGTMNAKNEASLKELDDRLTHLGEKYILIREDVTYISKKANSQDIQLAEINTKLNSIETILVEIKSDLKTK